MKQAGQGISIVMGLGMILLITILISFQLGRYPIPPKELFGILFSKVFPIEQFWADRLEIVLINIRLPRILLACLVGCCLSAAGAAYQGVFQNPMASPDILGASAGAAFGAALAILNHSSSTLIALSAFSFSLLTVAIVYFISKRAKGKNILGLILAGIMVSSLFSAGTSFIKLVADPNDQLPAITYWLMGSLSGAKLSDITFAIIPMAIGLTPLLLLRWRLNILTLGDDEAKTIGVNAKQIRLLVIICTTFVTAASVSVSGMIGWVGLVIPHLTRKLVGNNYTILMPASMLLGAIFLLIVDNFSRNLLTTEIPLGILTAFIGAPFFIYLITRKGESY
ncbi:ABC-type Fe3+-siderophore transport system, permease component [Desulfitobacterium dehalogenans ATCC 51507]|uniref:ABC-type Fe3+-siderophore transport system, permease component n=1 Tax=Desulfitobacterium dehalogenans (strain ATCC 51507 / DSM 9161 / JW/IU-DC1) TaxID=756499 RepID=I4AD67_DESDJ|nr:iron ABC transporter permease [Desulfitobacterium dehalogenans]AFM01902.1 ABC-type Fe3+-siderophore transport system, permease component [Desulfitobacterium dehalogenans ATCC 51507]